MHPLMCRPMLPLGPSWDQRTVSAHAAADVCPHFYGRTLAEGRLRLSSLLWATLFHLSSDDAVIKQTNRDVPFTLLLLGALSTTAGQRPLEGPDTF